MIAGDRLGGSARLLYHAAAGALPFLEPREERTTTIAITVEELG